MNKVFDVLIESTIKPSLNSSPPGTTLGPLQCCPAPAPQAAARLEGADPSTRSIGEINIEDILQIDLLVVAAKFAISLR